MKPPRRDDVLAALVMKELPALRRDLLRLGAASRELDDLAADIVVMTWVRLRDGRFVLPESKNEQRLVIRAYMGTIGRRLLPVRIEKDARERLIGTYGEAFDPLEWLEARSELRDMAVPDDLVPVLAAMFEGASIREAARAAGMRDETAYMKIHYLRIELRARAARRRKGG